MAEFRMPSLGADMEAGTLVEWMVEPGDTVARGDVIAVVETQKGAIEIEVFQSGTVEKFLVEIGDTVPVGTPLAFIRGEGEEPTPEGVPEAKPETPKPETPAAQTPTPPAPPSPRPGTVRASPAARRLAADKGIDLSSLTGSGPGGAVVYHDVGKALGAKRKPAKPSSGGLDLDAMREAIATAMARSKREIPHYYLSHTFDIGRAVDWLGGYNEDRPPEERLLMGALLVKTVALALGKYGEFNGFFEDGHFHAADGIHVGTAIAIRGGGLAAPAIHDVDKLPLGELMAKLRDLVARTRAGRLRSSEMTDPTVTVSSLGERGVEALYGVIYPPQVALVGFGRIETRAWAGADGTLSARPVMTATLAADHRVSDGHRGALFLQEIEKRLNDPEAL